MMHADTALRKGKVIQSTGAWYQVQEEGGESYACKLRGKFRLQGLKLANPVVVGDEVAFALEPAQAIGVIHEIMPRKNYLIRQAAHKKAYGQLLAANLDQAVLVMAADKVADQLDFIDRFLIVAEAVEIPPCLVFNKTDLLKAAQLLALQGIQSLYEKLGYATLAVSARRQQHLEGFRQAMLGKVSLLSGYSGVGKSTLLNMLAPEVNQAVAPPTQLPQRGRHTTTYAALFEVAPNTFVIDTPGIQTLVPYAIEKKGLGHCFPELRSQAAACKFYNCTHLHEPNCAVRQALATGAIATSRYRHYQQMMEEEK